MTDGVSESAQATPEVAQKAAEAANPVFELLSKVPIEIWVVLATAVVGAIGWFGKTAFDSWQKSRVPFRQDRDRYQAVIDSIDPGQIHYLKNTDFGAVGSGPIKGLDESCYDIEDIRKARPSYLHKHLGELENTLYAKLDALSNLIGLRFFPHHNNVEVFTIYWDTYNEWNAEDAKTAAEIRKEIVVATDRLISAYEEFRDYGAKLFADRLVKGDRDG